MFFHPVRLKGCLFALCGLLTALSVHAATTTTLAADGVTSTYSLIESDFGSGTASETPDCAHPEFGPHITQSWDSTLGKYIFNFFIHVTPDDDRCKADILDRQRNEIKTMSGSPAAVVAYQGDVTSYRWFFKLDSGFQPSPKFTHIHQIKAVNGIDNDKTPLITLTLRAGNPETLQIMFAPSDAAGQSALTSAPLSGFKGQWIEANERMLNTTDGIYELVLKRVSDGAVLLSYTNSNLVMWRGGSSSAINRPKWGIYRYTLGVTSDLRDEEVNFADFSITKGGEIQRNLPPSITTSPTNQTVYRGQNATFTVTATGSDSLYYQWRFNTTNILSWATGATLILTNAQRVNEGSYSVVVTNAYGATTSASAALTTLLVIQSDVFTTAGSTNWICPANVNSIRVECWGGGGAGGSAKMPGISGTGTGGGGAGGAYARYNSYSVIPGNIYTINTGAGGVSSTNAGAAVSGGDSWFNSTNSPSSTIIAKGGAGGESVVVHDGGFRYGAGGTGSSAGSFGNVVYAGGSGARSASAAQYTGGTGAAGQVILTYTINMLPGVSLTTPTNNAWFTAPALIALTATASDPDGTVTNVGFYNGATLLGFSTNAPYSYTWTNVAVGSYSLTARAVDNDGAIGISAAVAVTVANPVYTLTVNSGTGGGLYTNGSQVAIAADAPADGKVFDKWIGDTAYVANLNSASTTVAMPTRAVTLTATYVDVYYTLTVTSGSGGGSYTNGRQVAIAADAVAGKSFDHWIGDTQVVAGVGSSNTTVTMPAQAVALTAMYVDIYVLTVNGGSGDGNYTNGAQVVIGADPPVEGQLFDQWTGDIAYVNNVTYTNALVTMSTNAVTLFATYKDAAVYHLLTAGAGNNGAVSPASANVLTGNSTNFVITASNYYRIASLTTNGTAVTGMSFDNNSTTTNFTWSNVQTSGVLAATFTAQVVTNAADTPYEWLAGCGLTNYNTDADLDQDLDGLTAWQEYIAGTVPTNASSCLKAVQNTRNTITWNAVSGRVYSVYWSTNPVKGFTGLNTNIPYPQSSYTNATPDPRANYYQVKVRMQ